jgi:zinc transporter, ZIP family
MSAGPLLAVFAAALATALATGLGALPFVFVHHVSRHWLGISNALAAGFMIGASGGLIYDGVSFGAWRTLAGAAAGVVFIAVTTRLLGEAGPHDLGRLHGVDARKALIVVGVMTLHSFTEGVGVGVSFGDGAALGVLISFAIAVHNIPEGLAISLVLVPRGSSVKSAGWWSVFSSLPQPLMAVPAFAFVEAFGRVLPLGLGFAAGAMLWLALVEIVPDAFEAAPARIVVSALAAAAGAMLALQALIGA